MQIDSGVVTNWLCSKCIWVAANPFSWDHTSGLSTFIRWEPYGFIWNSTRRRVHVHSDLVLASYWSNLLKVHYVWKCTLKTHVKVHTHCTISYYLFIIIIISYYYVFRSILGKSSSRKYFWRVRILRKITGTTKWVNLWCFLTNLQISNT